MPRPLPIAIAASTLLILFAALPDHARGDPVGPNRIVSVGLGDGVSAPFGDTERYFKQGFSGQGFVRLTLGLPIAPRPHVSAVQPEELLPPARRRHGPILRWQHRGARGGSGRGIAVGPRTDRAVSPRGCRGIQRQNRS